MNDDKKSLAFFDFDGTLTKGDTLMPFIKFAVGARRYYVGLIRLSPILLAYSLSLISNHQAKEAVIRHYLSGFYYDHLSRLGKQFLDEIVVRKLCPVMIDNLGWHQTQGHRCIIVSASPYFYVQHFGKKYRCAGVLATNLEVSEGQVSGNFEGKNCYGDEKLRVIKTCITENSRPFTYAYGDSHGDKPMLEWADKGFLIKRGNFRKCMKVKIDGF